MPPFMAADITSGKLIADVQAAEIHKRSVHEPQHNCYDITYHNTVIIDNGALNYTWTYSRVG